MLKSIKTSITLFILFSSTLAFSQDFSRVSLSAAVGAVPTFFADEATVNTPPISAMLKVNISPSFTLGAYAGYSSSTSNSPYIISDGQVSLVSNKQTMVGLRPEMRKMIGEKFQFHGGALLGYSFTDRKEFDKATGATIVREPEGPSPFNPEADHNKFLYSGFIGTTYFVSKSIGVFAEVGYGVSLLNTGITINL